MSNYLSSSSDDDCSKYETDSDSTESDDEPESNDERNAFDGSVDEENCSAVSNEEIDCDSDLNDSSIRYCGEKQKRRNKHSEHDKAKICLSEVAINALLVKCSCRRTRKSENCKNDYKCANTLGSILEARELVTQFRKKFWSNSIKNKPHTNSQRTLSLLTELQALLVEDESSSTIDYKINGHRVCKAFYFEASGFSERLFNDAVAYVLGYRTSGAMANFLNREITRGTKLRIPEKLVRHCSLESAEHVVKFLNHYFTYSVEWSPNGE